jgi:nucleoside-diphosphate-sugar epimerase
MAGDLVLITGVTGHLGFRVLFEALSAGYKVRAVARSQFKADKILSVPSIKKLNSGNNLEFVIVPDLVATGAFDEAIKGATYVIHVASPLPIDEVSKQDLDRLVVSPSLKVSTKL